MLDNRSLLPFICGDKKCQEVPEKDWEFLSFNGYANESSLGCVGFCREPITGSLYVVLPKAFSAIRREIVSDRKRLRENIFRLISLFIRIRRISPDRIIDISDVQSRPGILKKTEPLLDSLEAAICLRKDYLENGPLFIRSSKNVHNAYHLPINWQRTHSQSMPLLDAGDAYYYDTLHLKKFNNSEDFICRLYASCLSEVFSLTSESSLDANVPRLDTRTFQQVRRSPSRYITPLLHTSYKDRVRKILYLILAYLEATRLQIGGATKKSPLLGYSASFENIWELILRDVLRGDADRRLETGLWIDANSDSTKPGITPETDIKVSNAPVDVLLDAKDYRLLSAPPFGSPNDYYKQIIYAELFRPKKNRKKVFLNFLLFPSSNRGGNLFNLLGCHYWKSLENSIVFDVTVDYERIVDHWLGRSRLDVGSHISLLFGQAEKMLPKI